MSRFRNDPLLSLARGILSFLIVGAAIIGIILLIVAPAMMIGQESFIREVADEVPENLTPQFIWGLSFLVLTGAVVMGLVWKFLTELRHIVDSVALGDPFVPENAQRLRRMGWITIIGQAATLPAAIVSSWISSIADERQDWDFGFSLSGLLLALVLFVLARVFLTGAAMRDELEGTV